MLVRHCRNEVRIDDATLHEVDGCVIEIVEKPIVVEEVRRTGQPGRPQDLVTGDALVTEVVDGVTRSHVGHTIVLVDLVQQDWHQTSLPVVAVDDVGMTARFEQELHGRFGKKGEPCGIVARTIQVAAREKLIA